MQTIGKTTNKMDFPKTWTDILLKSISGKTNYTIDVKIGTKRIATDGQDLREIPKKRRKQSNPTRISSNEENLKQGFHTNLAPPDGNKNENVHIEKIEEKKSNSNPQPSSSLPLNLIKSEHLLSDEAQKIQFSKNILQRNESPTEVHKNSSSPYQSFTKNNPQFEKKDGFLTESSSFMTLPYKNQPSTSTANIVNSSVQIFNPEAFCNQCNKEFCNKYFLKTHKANKHGVFVDGHSNSSILDQIDRPKISSFPVVNNMSSNTHDVSIETSTLSLFKSPALLTQPNVNTNTYVSKNMINNSTRAFCNICHKEFCNKYFVRRHKAKIHGIIEDGECKTMIDDIPFNFKANLQIKNEVSDLEISDTCDNDEKSPSFHVLDSISEIPINHAKSFIKDTKTDAENEEPIMKSVIVETPCHYIKVEHSDDEQNVNYINTLPNELCDENNFISSISDSTNIVDTNYKSTEFQNEFSNPNVENTMQQITEFGSNTSNPISTVTNKSECGVLRNSMGKTVNELNDPLNNAQIIENSQGIDKNTETDETQIELINKSKLLALQNFFSKLNGNTLDNMSICCVCNEHVEGSIKTHILNKHENLVHELMNESLESNGSTEYSCHECQQTFDSDMLLKAHIEHCECNVKGISRVSTSSKNSAENDDYVRYSREPGERKQSSMLSSFCKICNKELCNKYFMKTHMQRMHGISIQNGNHIGGVVCDICNKELCSKYFLRVHKQNSHGIVENGACQKFWLDSTHENGQLSDELDNSHRYYKHYTEVCNICFRRFRSSKWLSAHLLNDHGEEGKTQWTHIQNHLEDEKQNSRSNYCDTNLGLTTNGNLKLAEEQSVICNEMKQYRCSYCSFTTSILSFLFVHEKFHLTENKNTEDTSLTCTTCCVAFQNKTQLENHFVQYHLRKDSENSPVSQSPDNEDSSADKSMDTNGNDVFVSQLESSVIPCQTENVSTGKDLRIPESNHEPFIMQSFFLENCSVSSSVKTESSSRSDSFHSSLVYLPVKEKLTSTVNVFFKLTPT